MCVHTCNQTTFAPLDTGSSDSSSDEDTFASFFFLAISTSVPSTPDKPARPAGPPKKSWEWILLKIQRLYASVNSYCRLHRLLAALLAVTLFTALSFHVGNDGVIPSDWCPTNTGIEASPLYRAEDYEIGEGSCRLKQEARQCFESDCTLDTASSLAALTLVTSQLYSDRK